MTREEIRQKATECNRKREKTCNRMCCTDCSYRHPGCFTIYGYEHGFVDGVEEGKKQSIKHGHWIEVDFKRIDSDLVFLKCSNCFDVDVLYVRHMKYCPNCGARMDEEGEKNAENNTEFVPPDDSWDKVRNS